MKQDNNKAINKKENILIVDDSKENLNILSRILSEKYRISVAISGERALEIINNHNNFDMFILDIMMPEMDGITLCKEIKRMDNFSDVPVIFISALSDIRDKKLAFEAGGVDYIVKPFEREEVLLRVDTHLKIRCLQRELVEKNIELEKNYKRLKELEDLKDNLINMIVHDLRSPLSGVISMFDILKMELGDNKEFSQYIKSGYNAATSLLEMINSLLDVARLEEGKLPLDIKQNSIGEIINSAIQSIAINVKQNGILVDNQQDIIVNCDRELIKRVLINLISNSIKHSGSKNTILVKVESDDRFVTISVIDDGVGIPEEYHKKIFEKFGLVELRQEKKKFSTGLGLNFCKLVVEAHKGIIGLESAKGKGSRFYFKLPIIPE